MNRHINIAIIGDFNRESASHLATNTAIEHAARYLNLEPGNTWLPTASLTEQAGQKLLEQSDGVWAGPGSPYQSPEGALRGIRTARQRDIPFIGT